MSVRRHRIEQIVLFDGDCAFCSGMVRLSVKLLKIPTVGFVASGSEMGQNVLKRMKLPENPSTIFLLSDGNVLKKSEAAIALISKFRRPYCWMTLGRIFPLTLRDWVYDRIAQYRMNPLRRSSQHCAFSGSEEKHLIDSINFDWAELERILKK